MPESVSVALPVLNGGQRFREVLAAIRAQILDAEVDVVVIDSGSTDGSPEAARAAGARVEEIPRAAFSHGGTRNRLMALARGDVVAFLTQDAVPAHDRWLAALAAGFELGGDIALVCGPQLPRPGASPMARRELDRFFARFGAEVRVDRLEAGPLEPGPASFFSSVNGAVARWAWERIPFRPVGYAEDHFLAADVMRAGLAKAYMPDAAVVHSHDYPGLGGLRRTFDDFRALREVHGLREPLSPRWIAARIRNDVAAERAQGAGTLDALRYHAQRALGRSLGTNADRLPGGLRARLSREGRG